MRHLRLAAAIVIGFAPITVPAAGEQAFLPAQNAAAIVADGAPWSAASPSGRTFKLTLKKDGTGSISGALPFTLSVTWAVKGEAICISGTLMSKCLRFSEVPGGLQSWEDDKPDLKLSR